MPAWLGRASERPLGGERWHGVHRQGERFAQVRLVLPEAASLSDRALSEATRDAYLGVRDALGARHPVRCWNFLPGILDSASARRDRYMVFNTGRHDAFDDWFGTADVATFADAMPAATGVGIDGADLIIDVLADTEAGTAIENPRQRSAYRYSARYGPRPPCFARATRVAAPPDDPHGRCLLISGTASILGEDSVHIGQPLEQLGETLANLAALIETAGGHGLQDLVVARLYHLPHVPAAPLLATLSDRLAGVALESRRVMLCRPDLDVEIEAVAAFD